MHVKVIRHTHMVNESTSGIELVNWLCHMLLINITLFLFYLIYCFLLNPELNRTIELDFNWLFCWIRTSIIIVYKGNCKPLCCTIYSFIPVIDFINLDHTSE
jgi:hypothetical protein